MKTIAKKLYEAMFLVDTAIATSDWDGVIKTIEKILKKTDADLVSIKKWDERSLAYDVKGKSRGTYILCYFNSEGPKVAQIEREIRLTENIMRVLILSTEQMKPEDIERETPFARAQRIVEDAETRAQEATDRKALEEASAAKEDDQPELEQSDEDQAEEVDDEDDTEVD